MSKSDAYSFASANRELRLADLPLVAEELASRVRAAKFEPEMIVYVETGARLLAHELAKVLGARIAPVWVRRGGHGMKRMLAPVVRCLPAVVLDALRWLEERSGVQRMTKREAMLPEGESLAGRRVLLVDDAADTGRTIARARALLLTAGVREAEIRVAVIAATMAEGRSAVDFYLMDKNCRMPWSSDSMERDEAERRANELRGL